MWQYQNKHEDGGRTYASLLASSINKVVCDGYKECFKVTTRGLYSTSLSRFYRPEQVQIISVQKFGGQDTTGDNNATMYLLETSDGLKGTLVDCAGTFADNAISRFMNEVEEIRRKTNRHNNQNFC